MLVVDAQGDTNNAVIGELVMRAEWIKLMIAAEPLTPAAPDGA